MNVLFISKIPYPLNTGGNIRTFNLIKNVSNYSKISLIVPIFNEKDIEYINVLDQYCKTIIPVKATLKNPIQKYYEAFKNMVLTDEPYVTGVYVNRKFVKVIEDFISGNKIDIVHCDSISLAKLIFKIDRAGIPYVLNQHNIESLIWERYVKNEKNWIKKFYYRDQHQRLLKYEPQICRAYDQVIVVSDVEKEIMKKKFSINNVSVVENGVDIKYFEPENRSGDKYNMVFCGSMDWRPNIDATTWFIRNCFTAIQEKIPEITLTIVGRNPGIKIKKMAKGFKNIHVTGTVDDVRPYLKRASIFIVPLRIGGGSRLKILEAMSMGKPVISTTVGAEGLKVKNGEDIILADGVQNFIRQCVTLIMDKDKQTYLGKNGRELVVNHYSWHRLAKELAGNWGKAINKAR